MSRSFRSCLALALLLGLSGSLAVADDKMPTTPWYPLAVGNTWTYRGGDNRFELKVTEIKTVEGQPRAKLALLVNKKEVSFEEVGITKDAVLRYTFEGKKANPPIKFFELPPKADASWKVDSKMAAPKGVEEFLKGTFKAGKQESIKVAAGEYKAVSVTGQDLEANGVKVNVTYYFAEGVGMVKQVIELGGQKIVVELERFEPGKK